MLLTLIKDENGRKYYSSGSDFERQVGYSRALVTDNTCFVAGITGYDYEKMQMVAGGAGPQTQKILKNIAAVLEQTGFAMGDIVRITTIVAHKEDLSAVTKILGETMGDILAPNTLMVAELLNDEMLVEIEVTARRCR